MKRCAPTLWVGVVIALVCGGASAHELRPAYLDLLETSPGEYDVLWKTPMRGELQLSLTPEFSGETAIPSDPRERVRSGAAIEEWTLRAPALRGQTVRIRGLESTMTDTVVRIVFTDGSEWTHLLTPRAPSAQIPEIRDSHAPFTPHSGYRFPMLVAIAAWGAMCVAAAFARTRRRFSWTATAYAVGIVAAYFLMRSIVEFSSLT